MYRQTDRETETYRSDIKTLVINETTMQFLSSIKAIQEAAFHHAHNRDNPSQTYRIMHLKRDHRISRVFTAPRWQGGRLLGYLECHHIMHMYSESGVPKGTRYPDAQ